MVAFGDFDSHLLFNSVEIVPCSDDSDMLGFFDYRLLKPWIDRLGSPTAAGTNSSLLSVISESLCRKRSSPSPLTSDLFT